jgi:hypothetical protein
MTVDMTLEEIIIKERRGIRRANKRQQSEEDENLVDILLGLQERGGLGFHLTPCLIRMYLS